MKNGNNRGSCRHCARYSHLFVDAAANLKQVNVATSNSIMNETETNTIMSDQPSLVPSISDQPSLVPSVVPSEAPSDAPSIDNTLPPIPPPKPEQPDLEPIPASTWTRLARQFFRIDVSAGPKTRIPSNAVQAVRMRANGTQNYQCQQLPVVPTPYDNKSNDNTTAGSDGNNGIDSTSYKMAWVLRYPLANLWLYSTINGTVNMDRPPDGIHYAVGAPDESAGFANLVWDLGKDCHFGDPLYKKDKEARPPSCSTYLGRWRGQNPTSDPQVGTLAFLRLDKDETKMDPTITVQQSQGGGDAKEKESMSYYNALWQYSYMQRLRTFGGLVLPSGVTCESMADVNKTVSSVFEADFILSLKQVSFPPGVSGDIRLPDDCFQAHPFYANGYVDYENRNGTWVPIAGDGQQAQLHDQEDQTYHPVSFTTLHAYSTVDSANRTSTDDFDAYTIPSNTGQGPRMKVISENRGGVVGHNSASLLNTSIEAIVNNKFSGGNTTIGDSFLSFDVGGGCNNSDRICQNAAGSWDGFFISWEEQHRNFINLPLGLATVSSNIANTSMTGVVDNTLAPYHMVQQLLVRGGTAPPPPMDEGNDNNSNNNTDTNQTNSTTFPPVSPDVISWNNSTGNDNLTSSYYRSEFNCSFVFALCVRDVRASTPISTPVSSSSSAGSIFPYTRSHKRYCQNSSQQVVLFLVVMLGVLVFIDSITIIQVVC